TDHFGCRFPKGIEEIVAGLGGGTPLYPIPATIVGIRRRRAKIYGLEPVLGVILVAMTSVVRQISCRIVHIARRRNPICGRIERKELVRGGSNTILRRAIPVTIITERHRPIGSGSGSADTVQVVVSEGLVLP